MYRHMTNLYELEDSLALSARPGFFEARDAPSARRNQLRVKTFHRDVSLKRADLSGDGWPDVPVFRKRRRNAAL